MQLQAGAEKDLLVHTVEQLLSLEYCFRIKKRSGASIQLVALLLHFVLQNKHACQPASLTYSGVRQTHQIHAHGCPPC